MKLAFINGSPKMKNSSSESALKALKKLLPNEYIISEYNFRTKQIDKKEIEEIAMCDVIVFAFPLYVDGIPSHFISCLYQMERFFNSKPNHNIIAYAIVNCGFYEGSQNSLALAMIENWCEKSGVAWGQGVGFGGGGMLSMLSSIPEGKGPMKNIWKALKILQKNILIKGKGKNEFASPNFPRIAYKLAAEAGWRKQIKLNGLSTKDLHLKR